VLIGFGFLLFFVGLVFSQIVLLVIGLGMVGGGFWFFLAFYVDLDFPWNEVRDLIAWLLFFIVFIAVVIWISPDTQRPPIGPPPTPAHSPNSLSAIDELLAGLDVGNVAFNTPMRVDLGHSEVIQLLLSTQESVENLQAKIDVQGEKEGAQIRISNQVEARLSALGFKVEALTPERQAVSSVDTTEWKWSVEATRPGSQQLHLTLSLVLDVSGVQMMRTIHTFDKTIEVPEVEVPWSQKLYTFVSRNWQWLWAAILIPLVAWAGKQWRARKERARSGRPKVPLTPIPTSAPTPIPTLKPTPSPTRVTPTQEPTPTPKVGDDVPVYQADWSNGMNGWAGTPDWKHVPGMVLSDGSVIRSCLAY
jgi:hypothetical protein